MTVAETDILKKALFIIGREEVNAYKALPDEEVAFSKEFEDKVHLINKKRKSLFYQATKTVPRRIAVILVAAIIVFTMTMSISALRTPLINFIMNIYENYINIYFVEDEESSNIPTSIEHMYVPSYIPDNYMQIDSQNYGVSAETIWMNDESLIILNQDPLNENFNVHINNEGADYQTISISGNDIYYYVKDGYYFIIWTDQAYLFTITCPESISLLEVEKIISSME